MNHRTLHCAGQATLLVALLVANTAHAYRAELKEARELAELGANDQAVSLYEKALASPKLKNRNREKAEAELVRVKSAAASSHYRTGMKRAEKNQIVGAIAAYRKASQYDPTVAQYSDSLYAAETKLTQLIQGAERVLRNTRSAP